ncbi:hypothetical protein [Actinophytocola oryzae]|uniref:hypothetical protein n=1 Tax=Actinophytocola oryzae TaxID=502181 RepID=UPI001FBA793F|nr:hypothetical protein [Actinophytocola oryzae]
MRDVGAFGGSTRTGGRLREVGSSAISYRKIVSLWPVTGTFSARSSTVDRGFRTTVTGIPVD